MPVPLPTTSEFDFSLLSSPRSISEALAGPAKPPDEGDEDDQPTGRQTFTTRIPSYPLSPKLRDDTAVGRRAQFGGVGYNGRIARCITI